MPYPTVLTAALRARAAQARANQQLWLGALATANAVLIIVLWWVSSGSQPVRSVGDEFNAIGRVTGLFGTYLILWQLLLMTRQPWLENAFGMERLASLHRWNGYLAFGLLVTHAVSQTVGYQLLDRMGSLEQLGDFINAYDGVLPAIVGMALLVVVVLASITVSRARLAYETWYFIHLYAYLGIALAFSHQLATGADFIANPLFTYYWWALYAVVAGCLLCHRLGMPLLRYQRHRFRVQRIEREIPGVASVYVAGRRLKDLRVEAGQFMIWRFLDRKRWWQAHPFSLSAIPNHQQLRLTVRSVGDFSSRISSLRPGTRVMVEGPFGGFTERSRQLPKTILIAGGVGITPIRALAEEMAGQGVDVRVLYRCRREQDIIFRAELDQLGRWPRVRVDYLLSHVGKGRLGATDPLGAGRLGALVPDLGEREAYICGPTGMTQSVMLSLRRLGLRGDLIHTEAFRF